MPKEDDNAKLAFTLQSLDHADPFSDSAALPADVIHAIGCAVMSYGFVPMRCALALQVDGCAQRCGNN